MLTIGDYVIDRVTLVTGHESGVQFELLSGTVCTFPKSDPRLDGLVKLVKFCVDSEAPVVFRIVNGLLVATAGYLYRPVERVDRYGKDVVKVWISGRSGPCRLSLQPAAATDQCSLLARLAGTNTKLFFLIRGSQIEAITELTDEQLRSLRMLGARF